MLYQRAVRLHLDHLKSLNFAHYTMSGRRSHLKSFGEFLERNNIQDVITITPHVIERYRGEQLTHRHRGRQVSVAMHVQRLSALNRFFDTLIEKSVVLVNPARKIRMPHLPKRMPPRLPTVKEIHRLLQRMPLKTPMECRNRCVVELLYATGMRKAELTSLRVRDVDFEHGEVRVIGKGLKDRTLALTPRACQCLREYVRRVRPKLAEGPRLFPNLAGGPIQLKHFCSMFTDAAARAGVRCKIRCHLFRHLLATELLRNRANLRAIQEYLGHANIRTTVQYSHVLSSDLKKVHAQTHPREKGALK